MAAVTVRSLRPGEGSAVADLLATAIGEYGPRVESALRRYRVDPDLAMLMAAADGDRIVGLMGYALDGAGVTILHAATLRHTDARAWLADCSKRSSGLPRQARGS